MANRDNANGFTFVRSLGGEAVILTATVGAVALKKGDPLQMAAGLLTIALNDDTGIYGIMAADAAVGKEGKFYPALPTYVFEVQCEHGTTYSAATYGNYACDLKGATGVTELDLSDTVRDQFLVWKLADQLVHGVTNLAGIINSKVYCTIFQSQFLGMKGTAAVHA